MRSTYFAAFAIVATIASQSVPAIAGTIVASSATDNQSSFDNTGNAELSVADFNPTLGTLTSAMLTLGGITGPQFEVINIGPIAGTGTGSTTVSYTVTGPGVTGLSFSASSGQQSVVTGAASHGVPSLASSPPATVGFAPSVALSDLAAVTGSGSTSFNVSQLFTTSGTTDTVGAVLAFGGTASAQFGLNIVYTYTPASASAVPEPVSAGLLAVGLIGLAKVRRRRG